MASYGRTLVRVVEGEEPTPSGTECQSARMPSTALRLVPTSDKAITQKQERHRKKETRNERERVRKSG